MFLNESIGRTFDLFAVPKTAQQAAHQRGLAGAKITFQINDQSRHKYVPQPGAKRESGSFVSQRQGYRFMIGHG